VAVASGTGNVSLLAGNGDGTFQPALYFVVGSGPYSLAVADFNGDTKPDVAVADEFSNVVAILLNTTP
jgi:hypothetical protein